MRTVTRRPPTDGEMRALRFAWRVVKHVKSNAIVLATERGHGRHRRRPDESRGLGHTWRSRRPRTPTQGTVLASDAFFPFRDGVDVAAAAGVTAIIQPGGSVRDAEVIAAADEHGLAMVFTGIRHFRH